MYASLSSKSKNRLVLFILAVSGLFKFLLHYYFNTVVGSDGFLQSAAALSITKGHGYTIPVVNPPDLTTIHREYIINWPPLYSYLLAPILTVTKNNYELSAIVLMSFFVIAHQIILYKLIKKLGFPWYSIAIMLLLQGVSMPDYMVLSFPTDLIAITCWMAAIYFFIRFSETDSLKYLLFLHVFNFATVLLRFAYLPVFFVLPILLLWASVKNKKLLKQSLTTIIVFLSLLVSFLLYNQLRADKMAFFLATKTGFYPGNLVSFPPIFWLPFLNVNFVCTQVAIHTTYSYSKTFNFFKISGAIALLLIASFYVKKLISKKKFFQQEILVKQPWFILACSSIIAFLSIFIIGVTQNNYLPYPFDLYWTYFQDARYFLPMQYFVFLLVFYFFFLLKFNRFYYFFRFVKFLFFLFITIEIAHGLYFTVKIAGERKNAVYELWQKRWNFLDSVVADSKKQHIEPVLVSPGYNFQAYAFFNNIKVINKPAALVKGINTTGKSYVLILVKGKGGATGITPMDNFIQLNNAKEITTGLIKFYLIYL